MKILYLANVRLPTEKAHGLQIMQTCAAFAAAGHEVTLAVSSWQSSDEETIFSYYGLQKTFTVRHVSGGIFFSLGAVGFVLGSLVFALNARLKLGLRSYDAIYTRDEVLVRKGFFYEMHDVRKGIFQRHALARARGVIAISKGLADYCRAAGIPEGRVSVAPDGVDLDGFAFAEDREACRRKLGLPLDRKIALYAGHLYSWKGADVFARTTSSLPGDAIAAFVGGTDHELASFGKQFGSDPKIMIAGRQPHALIPFYLKAADILVLPNSAKEDISRLYTSPLKLFEYMASGTPIVASDLPSLREVLNDSNAVFAQPDDPASLAGKISLILADEELAERISRKAREDVKAYSWSARAATIASFISSASNIRTSKTKDKAFYDQVSSSYSASRYPQVSTDYTHFFFKKRLDITLGLLGRLVPKLKAPSLLEIGCADGVVLKEIFDAFGTKISSYVGIDTSPKMVETAMKMLEDTGARFAVRDSNEKFDGIAHDLIIEIGVLNYADFDADMKCAAETLPKDGYYICSVAGRGSLWDRLVKVDKGFNNFQTYPEYEQKIRDRFEVVTVKPVGLRIPYIWRVPVLARAVQPVIEAILSLFGNLFHEKVYLLKKKDA